MQKQPRDIAWAKVLLFFVIIIILSGLVAKYCEVKYRSVIAKNQEELYIMANHIELFLNSRLLALQTVAVDKNVVSLDPLAVQDKLSSATKVMGFFNAVLFYPDGTFIAEGSSQYHIDKVYDDISFKQALQGKPVISNRIIYAGLDSAYVSLRVPVYDAREEIRAVLVAGMPINELSKLISQEPLSIKRYFFVLDNNGNFIYHPRLKEFFPEEKYLNNSLLKQNFLENKNGYITTKALTDGLDKLYVYRAMAPTDWRIVMAIPLSSLYYQIFIESFPEIIILLLLMALTVMLYQIIKRERLYQNEVANLRLERLATISQMAAGLAHEIRNPLTSIKGFIQLIKIRGNQPVPDDHIGILSGEIERMEKLMNEFNMLARPPQPPVFEQIDLNKVITDTVTLMRGQASGKGVNLNYTRQPGLSQVFGQTLGLVSYDVRGDASQLKQVFINLIRNGIEAVDSGGTVNVSFLQFGDTVEVRIRDNGPGIPDDIVSHLGTPFFTTKENGTGLGLSVCYSIIEGHEGSLVFTSKPGEGTEFIVSLPLVKRHN